MERYYANVKIDEFYRNIDQDCILGKLRYNAPKPLEHYYYQEKDTGFRGITVFRYPNAPLPEVIQKCDDRYGQYTGICNSGGLIRIKYDSGQEIRILDIGSYKQEIELYHKDLDNRNIRRIRFNNITLLHKAQDNLSQEIKFHDGKMKSNMLYMDGKYPNRPIPIANKMTGIVRWRQISTEQPRRSKL